MIIVMIIKVKKLLWLRQARVVFEPSKESEVQYAGIPIVQGRQQEHNGYNDSDIHPFRRVTKVIEHETHDHNHCHGERIANIHCSLIEPRFRLKAYPAVRAVLIHYVEFGNLRNGVLEHITFPAPWTLTVKQCAHVTSSGHSCWIYTIDIQLLSRRDMASKVSIICLY
jgi:hypothetical protein